jgi:hypothetical protein
MNVHTGTTNSILLQLALTEKVMLRHMLHHNWSGVTVASQYCDRLDGELRRRHAAAKKAQHRMCGICLHERVLRMLHNLDKEVLRETPSPAKKKVVRRHKKAASQVTA